MNAGTSWEMYVGVAVQVYYKTDELTYSARL